MIKNLNGLEINNEYSLPAVDGTSGQVMKTDGSGVLSWDNDNTGAEYIDDLLDAKTDATSVFLGNNSGANDDGNNFNTAVGVNSLKKNTSGSNNTSIGNGAMFENTNATDNTAIGYAAFSSNSNGNYNTVVGSGAMNGSSGSDKSTVIGFNSLADNSGDNNTSVGYRSGQFISGGAISNQTSSNSVYIGAETKSLADGDTNEIVIGYNTTGKGSNTATLGNDSIVETHLKGVVVMGKAASAPTGVEGGIYYDTATKHFYGYDGTTWKQLDN